MLLSTNSKLKKDRIYSFSLPAGHTCPNAGTCKAGCYALSGRYKMRQCDRKRRANYAHTTNPILFKVDISLEIERVKPKLVRVHDSGDFYSKPYLGLWLEIATDHPNTLFYAYTKQVAWIKECEKLGLIPQNFIFILSYGGTEDHLINPKQDRHARVFESNEALENAGYVYANESDILALGLDKKIGLVYHGVKKYKNTEWSK